MRDTTGPAGIDEVAGSPESAKAEETPAMTGDRTPEVASRRRPTGRRRLDLGRPHRAGAFLTVVTLAALIAAIVTAAVQWRSSDRMSQELSAQAQARARAAEFARAFLVYHKTDLQGWQRRLGALATPEYRGPISEAVRAQFPLITSLRADSRVTVRDVFINDFDGPAAKTMVVADTEVTSKDFVRTVRGMRLLVELSEQKDGRWLVSSVGVLGIDDENMTDHAGRPIDASKIRVPDVSSPGSAP